MNDINHSLKNGTSSEGQNQTTPKSLYQNLLDALIPFTELADMTIPPKKRILGQWFKEADIGFLYAPRGLGKTWIVNVMANAIASGKKLEEWEAGESEQKVLIIDGEMALQQTQDRAKRLQIKSPNLAILHHEHLFSESETSLNIADSETQQAIVDLCISESMKVLILDNLSSLAVGLKENESDDWEKILPWLLRLRRLNIATVIVAHANKSGLLRGTSRKEDCANWILQLSEDTSDAEEKDGARFLSRFEKNRNSTDTEAPNLKWTFQKQGETTTCVNRRFSSNDRMLDLIRSGITSNKDLVNELDVSKGAVTKMAKKLESEGYISITSGKYLAK